MEKVQVNVNYRGINDDLDAYFTLNAILMASIAVTSPPNKIIYRLGEPIDYTGMVITATYKNDTTKDITNLCTITPQSGKSFDPNYDSLVEILYTEGQDEQNCYLTLTEEEYDTRLVVDTMPTKTEYKRGEDANYSGIVVKAVCLDGSEHNITDYCTFDPADGDNVKDEVTVYCAAPATPYVFNQNSGYIASGAWIPENPTNTFIDVYRVTAGHKYLLTLGAEVGSRFRVMFTTTDISQASSRVNGTNIINANSPAAYASVEYTPSSNGYIAVGKDNIGKSGVKTYLYDANTEDGLISTTFYLTVKDLESLDIVSMPSNINYTSGELIDYSGLIVNAVYSDGSTENVTSLCTITPAEGTAITVSTEATISYTENDVTLTTSLTLVVASLESIEVTMPPNKTAYRYYDSIDYTGIVVMATYSDGSTVEVSSRCTFLPRTGSRFRPDSDYINPVITFGTVSTSLTLEYIPVTDIEVTSYPSKMEYKTGERIDYTGLVVVANYADGSTQEVSCSVRPAANKAFAPQTDADVTLTYSEFGVGSYRTSFSFAHISLMGIAVTTSPRFMTYKPDETITYFGLVVTATYLDGSTANVTSSCTITPAEGKAFDPDTDTEVLISYSEQTVEGIITETASLTLMAIELLGITVTANPHKTGYSRGEPIDYSGLVVTASYSDGSSEDVTGSCTITPSARKAFDPDSDTDVEIAHLGATTNLVLTEIYLTGIAVTHNPYRTAYKNRERISYAGMVVTATYSDESTFAVTSKCSLVPANNKRFDPEEDTNVEVTYADSSCNLTLMPILLTGLQVTQNPAKMQYFAGEAIDYSGIVISAIYSDESREYVTEDCTFSPATGTVFASETEVTITYQEQTCNLTLTAAEDRLLVSKLPRKIGYKEGDTIDYFGIEIQASYKDGSLHTVTDYCDFSPAEGSTINADTTVSVNCPEPMEPYAFDITNGYVADYGTWNISQDGSCYSDVYRVTAGHRYLIAMGLAESFKYDVLFTTRDITIATSTVSDEKTLYRWSKDSYNEYGPQSYTPSSSGYLVITKSNSGVSGIKTYLYDADSQNKTLHTSFYLTVGELASISVSQPVKARYRVGEAFDYTGVLVSAKFSDGHIENVTEDALFSPPNGTIATSDSPTQQVYTQVTVGYHNKYACFHVLTSGIAIMSLRLDTPPNKTYYYPGETLDYSGLTVSAVYWDGRQKDVTHLVSFNPPAGQAVSPTERFWDSDWNRRQINNQVVSITYTEPDETACSNVTWNTWTPRDENGSLVMDKAPEVDLSTKQYHYGSYTEYADVTYLDLSDGQVKTQTFSFDGISVAQAMSTSAAIQISPAGGDDDSYTVTVVGTKFEGLEQRGNLLGGVISTWETTYGVIVSWDYVYWMYDTPLGETFVPILTLQYQGSATYDINVTAFGLESLLVTKLPNKTVYSYNEYVNTTGWEVIAYYTDGTIKDVSSEAHLASMFYSVGLGQSPRQEQYYDSDKKGYNVPIEYESKKAIIDGKEVYLNGARKVTGSFFISYTG